MFRICDSCEIHFNEAKMERIYGNYWFCNTCMGDAAAPTRLTPKEPVAQCAVPTVTMTADEMEAAHALVLDAIAEKHSVNIQFVHWVLYDAEDADIEKEQTLISQRIQFEEDYSEFMEMVTERMEEVA